MSPFRVPGEREVEPAVAKPPRTVLEVVWPHIGDPYDQMRGWHPSWFAVGLRCFSLAFLGSEPGLTLFLIIAGMLG